MAHPMPERGKAVSNAVPEVTEKEIDDAIAEAGGDAREAVRNLLHDIALFAADRARIVSYGYVYGAIELHKL